MALFQYLSNLILITINKTIKIKKGWIGIIRLFKFFFFLKWMNEYTKQLSPLSEKPKVEHDIRPILVYVNAKIAC